MPWVKGSRLQRKKGKRTKEVPVAGLPESEKRIVGRTVEMVRTQGVGGWEKTAPSGASAAAMVWTVCRFVKSSIVKRTEAEI